ncbi:hypothetical protein [Roseicyclus sp.]|uniref:hypothetical protein n=1 Tax=Roseicyclus sp. TaxID=1914329 RepID=UPI003F6C0CDE
MSTQTATPTIEDSIKTALDAADTAITVTREFDQVRSDYAKTRVEVKAVNRQIMIVFISSLVASVIAVAAAGLIYFRTMSEMETTNATSLEALVIFAENVDRLAAATTEANAQAAQVAGLVDSMGTLEAKMNDLVASLDAQAETTLAEMTNAQTELTNIVSQGTSAVVRELSATIAAEQSALMAQLEAMRTEPQTGAAAGTETETGTAIGTEEAGPSPFDEIKASLETMMLLQREISAKITAASTPPRAPARTPQPQPPAPRAPPNSSDIITFP